ncbi:MAG: sterol desaturase family protein, partial [Gemmatimonadota bacterium]
MTHRRRVAGQSPRLPGWVTGALGAGALALLVWLEHRRGLRQPVEATPRRQVRNLGVAAVSAAVLQVADRPFTRPLAALVVRRRWGLLQWIRLPRWLEVTLAVILLDYTLYLWHVLTHRVPALWRFHMVHHADLDLDATTALRFHFGELAISVPWRAGQIALI